MTYHEKFIVKKSLRLLMQKLNHEQSNSVIKHLPVFREMVAEQIGEAVSAYVSMGGEPDILQQIQSAAIRVAKKLEAKP